MPVLDSDPEQLRYPIGRFAAAADFDAADIAGWLDSIAAAPDRLRDAVAGLDPSQLDTPYRPGGWTVRQVVHHVPDSHINGYVRTCLALTEDEPTIRPYDENAWSALPHMRTGDPAGSLALLETVHARWLHVLQAITPEQWTRRFIHPVNGATRLAVHVQNYAWHGEHHVAHITSLRRRNGW